MTAWGRVLDWRLGQLQRLTNVTLYAGNELSVEDILGLEHQRVVIATGARWTRSLYSPLEIPVGELAGPDVYTPDDIAAGANPEGPIVVFDFDNYYMGSLIAEHLARTADSVTYVTPAGHASAWAIMTNEQPQVHRALANAGVQLLTLSRITALADGEAIVANLFTGVEQRLPCRSLVIVGMRAPRAALYQRAYRAPRRCGISRDRLDRSNRRCTGAWRHRARRSQRSSLCARARRHRARRGISARRTD